MADLRRRKPDDDSGKAASDDVVFSASKPERSSGDGANGSDDEHLHHTKPSSGLTTADSSDHVNKHFIYSQFTCVFCWFICLHRPFAENTLICNTNMPCHSAHLLSKIWYFFSLFSAFHIANWMDWNLSFFCGNFHWNYNILKHIFLKLKSMQKGRHFAV